MLRRRALGTIVLLAVLPMATSGCGDDNTLADSGPDLTADDAGLTDAGSRDMESGEAGTRDTGLQDAQAEDLDAFEPNDLGPEDPGWVRVEGLPDWCTIERATFPQRLWRSEWLSCGEGCTYLSQDPIHVRAVQPIGAHDGSRGIFIEARTRFDPPTGADGDRSIAMLSGTDGSVFGAWRSPAATESVFCGVRLAAGPHHAVVLLRAVDGSRGLAEAQLYYDTLENIGQADTAVTSIDREILPIGAILQNRVVSADVFAAELKPANKLLLLRPDGALEIRRPAGNPLHPKVVGADVFYELLTDNGYRVEHTRFGEEPNVLLADPEADILAFTATDDTFAWYRRVPRFRQIDPMDLYTAPFATHAEDLAPRFVRNVSPELRTGYDGKVISGEGLFSFWRPSSYIRLSDGAVLKNPPGLSTNVVSNVGYLWMNDGEVDISAAMIRDAGTGGTVRRVRLDHLVVAP